MYPFDDGDSDSPSSAESPDVLKVKVEESSPVLHEEPSSTSEAADPVGDSPLQGVHSNSHLQADVSSSHDNPPLVTRSSNECIPDSTTAHMSPDEYAQVDSGYNSRLQSTSSTRMQSESGSAFTSSPESVLSGPSSIPKSMAQFQDLFPEFAESIPTEPYSRSGSTSDPPHHSPVTHSNQPSLYQLDPVIQEITSQCDDATLPATAQPCHSSPAQDFVQSQVANPNGCSPEMYVYTQQRPIDAPQRVVQGRQPESSEGNVMYPPSALQQPLGYHGNYAPPTLSSQQVNFNSHHSQMAIKQEVSPEESSCNPCNARMHKFTSYQHQIAQQHHQLQENGGTVLFGQNFNFAQQQQQSQPLRHVEQNSARGYGHAHHSGSLDPATNGSVHEPYSSNPGQMPAFANPSPLPSSNLTQNITIFASASERLHHLVDDFHHSGHTSQHGLFNSTPPTTTTSFFSSGTTAPLSHLPNFDGISMSFQVGDVTVRDAGRPTSDRPPNLASLTGEDLQILEYLDQLDSGGSIKQLPTHSHHSLR